MRSISLLFVIVLLQCCKSSGPTNAEVDQSSDTITSSVSERLGNKYSCEVNESSTYTLCYAQRTEDNLSYLSFVVYQHSDNQLSYESKERIRSVQWENDKILRIERFTGMPKEEGMADFYFLNVATNKISASYSKP